MRVNLFGSSRLVFEELDRRGYKPVVSYSEELKTVLSFNVKGVRYYIKGTVHPKTSANGYIFAEEKGIFYELAKAKWSIPKTFRGAEHASLVEFISRYAPIVVKPNDQGHGIGVSLDLKSISQVEEAMRNARKYSNDVIVQQQVPGKDYRLLVINGKFIAATLRDPASVKGDGIHTVLELILLENKKPERGKNYSKSLEMINVKKAKTFLGSDCLSSVPEVGEVIYVLRAPNIGQGGKPYDVTNHVAGEYIRIAEEVATEFEVYCCGVDIITSDISKFNGPNSYAIVEINASPSFGMHTRPFGGKRRDPTPVFVDSVIEYLEKKRKTHN